MYSPKYLIESGWVTYTSVFADLILQRIWWIKPKMLVNWVLRVFWCGWDLWLRDSSYGTKITTWSHGEFPIDVYYHLVCALQRLIFLSLPENTPSGIIRENPLFRYIIYWMKWIFSYNRDQREYKLWITISFFLLQIWSVYCLSFVNRLIHLLYYTYLSMLNLF